MEKEIKLYQSLNALANTDGCVIFGDTEDKIIPLSELKEAFELQGSFYNRSFTDLCVSNAIDLFDRCVAPLGPKDIYLHIGQNDLALFAEDAAAFDQKYTLLVQHIRSTNKKCSIAIISLKNPGNDPSITELNKHLAVIAQNENCEFCDIANIQVWNPLQTKEVVSFLYSIGFVRPLKQKRPLRDVVKILFCYEPNNVGYMAE